MVVGRGAGRRQLMWDRVRLRETDGSPLRAAHHSAATKDPPGEIVPPPSTICFVPLTTVILQPRMLPESGGAMMTSPVPGESGPWLAAMEPPGLQTSRITVVGVAPTLRTVQVNCSPLA